MGKLLTYEPLVDRKLGLKRFCSRLWKCERLLYADHVEGAGQALFSQVCRLDLEGIVAKYKTGAYVGDREKTTWFKIRNRDYSQMVGRVELFERERRSEPVPAGMPVS
jgi:ATP-dependent DNA ligase